LAIPFVFALCAALLQAANVTSYGVIAKERYAVWAYYVATACSSVYFFVVSFSLLRDRTWANFIGLAERKVATIQEMWQTRYLWWPEYFGDH
jgi:hypothetical protein